MANTLKIVNVTAFVILSLLSLSFIIPDSFAETEKLTVSAGDTESLRFYLEDGDRIKFWIAVSGGANDDVNISIKNPNGGIENEGLITASFNDEMFASTTGTYYFEFDNSFSLLSTKYVTFDYQIIKKPVPIPSPSSYGGGGGGGGEWLWVIVIGLAIGIPIILWKKKKNKPREEKPEEVAKAKDDSKSEEKGQIRSQNEKALKILKERLAKGEISKKEYDELKKEFDEDV